MRWKAQERPDVFRSLLHYVNYLRLLRLDFLFGVCQDLFPQRREPRREGDRFVCLRAEFTILIMKHNRIIRLKARRLPEETGEEVGKE